MRRNFEHRGWKVAVEIEDIGSGASKCVKREKLLDAARGRELDAIAVWKLDRWGRSLLDLIVSLRELGELGVGFVSLTEALDLTTSMGRAIVEIFAVFAEFESDILRERVKAGIAQARRRGTHLGRPSTTKSHVEEIAELRAGGASKSEIARRLGLTRASVRRALAQEAERPTPSS